jgi:uroporphyrinogen-III synthase
MSDTGLAGVGVLVTRPDQQADELAQLIESHGGQAFRFPTIKIVPRETAAVNACAAALPNPDIAIFVSSNAVRHGLELAEDASIAAIGPATAAAIEAAGRSVDICPEAGFDSEHLLAEAAFEKISNATIRIIRGQDGRELLATTLRDRGATVDYLVVYDRLIPEYGTARIDEYASRWQSGDINVVTAMSVAALENLIALTPDSCMTLLARTPLVTPASRVIKEALNRFPDIPAVLAEGPRADEIVRTISALGQTAPGQP